MADETSRVTRCASCQRVLAEPAGLAPEDRKPCPDCGSTARIFELGLTATVVAGADLGTGTESASVTVHPEPGVLRLEADAPEIRIEDRVAELEHAGFDVTWLRLSPGGAWMVRVFDRDGNWTDGSIQDDPVDALLAVAERLLPNAE